MIPFTIRLALGISVLAFMSPVVVGPFASAVQATTYSWDGGGGANSNFNNATNWSTNITPLGSDTALFNLGSSATYTVKFPGSGTFNPINFVNDSLVVRSNTVSFVETTAPSTYALTNPYSDRPPGVQIAPEAGDNAILNDSLVSLLGVAAMIGDSAGSHGTLNVSGGTITLSGSDSSQDELIIGNRGNGALNITAGAHMNVSGFAGSSGLGEYGGSTGAATVSGVGSTWASGYMHLGHNGSGTLGITAGGQVSSTTVIIGDDPASNGAATVGGTNSTWTTNDLYLGFQGTGTLGVTDGARILIRGPGAEVSVGTYAGGTGTLTVDGAGSVLRGDIPTTDVVMEIGTLGSGTLNITGGGQVSDNEGRVGYNGSSSGVGTVTVDGTGSTWSNTGQVHLGLPGSGTLTVSNGGTVNVSGTFQITTLGTLNGNGNIAGVVYNDGVVAPGLVALVNSPGALHIDGNYFQSPPGKLQIQLADTQYDQLLVSGAVTLGGTLDVSLLNGFSPQSGNTFNVLDWSTRSGTFSTVNLPALAGSLQWDTSQLYTTGVLSVAAGIPGDFNQDGRVDAADYATWRKGLGTIYTQSDYDLWRAHFGQSAGSRTGAIANSAVPEPAMLLLLMSAAAGWCLRRGRAA